MRVTLILLLFCFLPVICACSSNSHLTDQQMADDAFKNTPDTEISQKLKSVLVAASENMRIAETKEELDNTSALVEKCNAKKADKLSSCSKDAFYCDTIADAVIRNCFSNAGFVMTDVEKGYKLERIDN